MKKIYFVCLFTLNLYLINCIEIKYSNLANDMFINLKIKKDKIIEKAKKSNVKSINKKSYDDVKNYVKNKFDNKSDFFKEYSTEKRIVFRKMNNRKEGVKRITDFEKYKAYSINYTRSLQ